MMTPLPVAALAALTAAVVLGGCAAGDQGPGTGAPNVDAVPTLALDEVARIGSTDDPDYGFSRIGSATVDDDGHVYVYEIQDRQIRVYAPEGELIRRIGGAGEGPGEFAGPGAVRFGVRGDTVWAFDPSARRITLFDRSGQVLSTARITPVSTPLHGQGHTAAIWPAAMDDDGLFVGDRGMATLGGEGGVPVDSVLIPRVRFDAAGQVVDTVGRYALPLGPSPSTIDVGRSTYLMPLPPGSDPVLVRLVDGHVRIDQSVPEGPGLFRVTRLGHEGDTLRSTLLAHEPRPFPDEVLNAAAVRSAHREGTMVFATPGQQGAQFLEAHAADSAAARRAILDAMPFPEHQRPVQSYTVAADGSLWLRREDGGDDQYRWTVLDREDQPVGELVLPRTTRILWTDGDLVWTAEPDALGVPWLVGYRIVEAES